MSYLVLARKYRPSTFSDVIGQEHVIRTLRNSIVSGRIAHAFLLCGVRGVGKTTVARVLAKALNCTGRSEQDPDPCDKCASCREIADGVSVDVHEIDGASNTSVENIRDINENIKYPPISSRFKIIIIDEVHMISINAFNALLKTLEEPPSHAKFVFATTESHKVPATINSRCQRFNFRTISLRDMIDGMSRILDQEGIAASEETLALVAAEANGSFRDALSLLDQVIAYGSGKITHEEVVGILGVSGRGAFAALTRALLERDPAQALRLVHEQFQQGYGPEQFVLDMMQYLRNLTVVITVPAGARAEGMIDASQNEIDELERLASMTSAEELQNLFGILFRSEAEIRRANNPWTALEMTILKMAYAPQVVELSKLIEGLESGGPLPAKPVRRKITRPESERPEPVAASAAPTAQPTKRKAPESQAEVECVEQPQPSSPKDVPEEPAGTPDEIWAELKDKVVKTGRFPILASVMDHGSLISLGPTEVEIGFNKAIYKEQFEGVLADKEDARKIFQGLFGKARLKILVLAKETSLDTKSPYEGAKNGETDRNRALKQEAIEHPIVKAIQTEFEGSVIDDIKVIS